MSWQRKKIAMTDERSPDPPFGERKKEIARWYSEKWKFWKNVYDDDREALLEDDDAPYPRRRDLILTFVDEFAKTRELKMIDVGCGAGGLMTGLIERGHSVVGVDISTKMAEVTQKAADERSPGKAMCCAGDIESLPFCDGSFDVVIAAGILSHQMDDLPSIRELSRVAKSNGMVIVTLPNRLKLKYLLDPYYYLLVGKRALQLLFRKDDEKLLHRYTLFKRKGSIAVRKYYYGQLNRAFRENGFRIRRMKSCGFGPLTFFRRSVAGSARWELFSDRLETLSSRRIFSFLNLFATFWVIVLDRVSDP